MSLQEALSDMAKSLSNLVEVVAKVVTTKTDSTIPKLEEYLKELEKEKRKDINADNKTD